VASAKLSADCGLKFLLAFLGGVSKGKLTRQELGWLLTQEAQGAAERLRKGVSALTHVPPASRADASGGEASGVDASLSALDDTMRMLSTLHARPVSVRGRRGRIDLASLLWEIAPEARVSIEPGSGTEVFGDEAELRRMLHVVLGHGSGSGSAVTIRREGDEVVIAVLLGPDSSATADTERAWLSRMAVRYGGRYELDGGTEFLALPAEGVEARDDVAKLRKELDEARKQGEAYARELAAVWSASDEGPSSSSHPPALTATTDRYGLMVRFSGGVAATLRAILSPIGRELADLRPVVSSRRSSPDLEAAARGEGDDKVEGIRRKLAVALEFATELASIGESDVDEATREVDLVEVVRGQVRGLEGRVARSGVAILVRTVPDDPSTTIKTRVAPRAAALLARELLSQAVAASTRGSVVVVTLHARAPGTNSLGARLVVDDTGTSLPASARRALLGLEVEPGTFGRPNGVALFVAAEIAAALGALLEIGDTLESGMRVTVTFPRSA
jgi:two-component system OmpR family sensor kinase